MKDADFGPHESWCDTQNKISERCNCMASVYIDKIESSLKMLEEINNELLWIGDNTKESRIRKVADTITDKYRAWREGIK